MSTTPRRRRRTRTELDDVERDAILDSIRSLSSSAQIFLALDDVERDAILDSIRSLSSSAQIFLALEDVDREPRGQS